MCEECYLVDVELGLASGHFSVAGAELANKVVTEKEILITSVTYIKKKHKTDLHDTGK